MPFGEMPGKMPGREAIEKVKEKFRKKRDKLRKEIEKKRAEKARYKEIKRRRKAGDQLTDPTQAIDSGPGVSSKVSWGEGKKETFKPDLKKEDVKIKSDEKWDAPEIKNPGGFIKVSKEVKPPALKDRYDRSFTTEGYEFQTEFGPVTVAHFEEIINKETGKKHYIVRVKEGDRSKFFRTREELGSYLLEQYVTPKKD